MCGRTGTATLPVGRRSMQRDELAGLARKFLRSGLQDEGSDRMDTSVFLYDNSPEVAAACDREDWAVSDGALEEFEAEVKSLRDRLLGVLDDEPGPAAV